MSYSIVQDSDPSTVMPCPHITIKSTENSLQGIKKHFDSMDELPDSVAEEPSIEELKDAYEYPLLGSSMPLLSKIYLSSLNFDIQKHEDLLVDILSHETLHILLYKLEGERASIQLDARDNL